MFKNPKPEIRSPKEIRNLKSEFRAPFLFSGFGLRASFGFRGFGFRIS